MCSGVVHFVAVGQILTRVKMTFQPYFISAKLKGFYKPRLDFKVDVHCHTSNSSQNITRGTENPSSNFNAARISQTKARD